MVRFRESGAKDCDRSLIYEKIPFIAGQHLSEPKDDLQAGKE
jgi:hypothetical protein